MTKLILFGTAACHLCESAEALLVHVLANYPDIELELIDITEQTQWQEQYAIKIPVLFSPSTQQELDWPFDKAAVIQFLA